MPEQEISHQLHVKKFIKSQEGEKQFLKKHLPLFWFSFTLFTFQFKIVCFVFFPLRVLFLILFLMATTRSEGPHCKFITCSFGCFILGAAVRHEQPYKALSFIIQNHFGTSQFSEWMLRPSVVVMLYNIEQILVAEFYMTWLLFMEAKFTKITV